MDPQTRAGVRLGVRIAFAHHPLCHFFHEDTIRVGRLPVCSGCIVTWPLFFVSLPIAIVIVWLSAAPAIAWMLGGGLLGIPQLLGYVRRPPGRLARALTKAVGGIGLAFLVAGGAALPVPLWIRVAGFAALLLAFLALQVVRLRSILAICDACPWQRDWGHCPGFHEGAPSEPPATVPAPQ